MEKKIKNEVLLFFLYVRGLIFYIKGGFIVTYYNISKLNSKKKTFFLYICIIYSYYAAYQHNKIIL